MVTYMNDKTLQSLEDVRIYLAGNWTLSISGKDAQDDCALPGSMTDYLASAEVFDGVEWASAPMNLSIRFRITQPMVKANGVPVISGAAKGTSWGPIGMENRVI